MEHPEKISCNFPKLSQFKGQPWSSLTTFLNETYKPCEDYSITNYAKKEIDTETPQKTEMDSNDLSRFRGQPWSSWINSLDLTALTNNVQNDNPDTRVTRLPRKDMGLFGICPENERFCAVVCSTCGAVVKPQGLQRHLEIKHTSDSESALLPPPQVPVKKTKTASVKMKNKESTAVPLPVHSSDNVVPSFPSVVSVKQIESSTSTTSTSKSFISKVSNLSTSYDTEAYSHSPRRKSPNINIDRKSQKSREKDVEPEKHSTNEDSKQISNRQLNSKSQLPSPRRSVTGRTKDFNKLVAEHRATKEQPPVGGTTSNKSRPQSILKTVVATSETADSGFSSSTSSQSSQSTNQDTSPVIDVSPVQTSPPSPTLSLLSNSNTIASTCLDTPGTSSPIVATAFSSSEYLVNSGSSACSSPTIVSSGSSSLTTDVDSCIPVPSLLAVAPTVSVSDNSESGATLAVTTTQIVQVVPHTHTYTNAPSHSFTVKLPRSGSPIIILNNNKANANISASESSTPQATPVPVPVPVPSVNLNVNTESSSNVPVMNILPVSPSPHPQPQPVVVSRDVIESLNVPVVMEMPTLSDSLTNITVYTSYPKPLVVSTFSAKKVGHAVVFSNRRLDFIRSQFKSVLKKNRRIAPALHTLKSSQNNPAVVSSAATVFGVKTLNATTACRFPKTTTTVSGIQATSLLAHRPNILRTASPKQTTRDREREQNVPKILTTGLKRPASSSPQLAGLDCKHMLLKPTANNINVNGIIGKMIVHQHEMTDSHSSEGPTTNHLALDKVVPVNIK